MSLHGINILKSFGQVITIVKTLSTQLVGINSKRKVILVTDGDLTAKKAVESACINIGARCISSSAGNPTWLSGEQIVSLIKTAPHDPVVVMLDDRGHNGKGKGERALVYLASHPDIDVIGVLAVASNTKYAKPVKVDFSIDCRGKIVTGAVDKNGKEALGHSSWLSGDTVEVLENINIPIIIGIGDIGKMNEADDPDNGAPLTTKALKEILNRSGFY